MQQQMMVVQEGLKEKELTASVGGGAVTVRVNGQKELLEVKLSDEIVKEAAEDKEMLRLLLKLPQKKLLRQKKLQLKLLLNNRQYLSFVNRIKTIKSSPVRRGGFFIGSSQLRNGPQRTLYFSTT